MLSLLTLDSGRASDSLVYLQLSSNTTENKELLSVVFLPSFVQFSTEVTGGVV